MTDYRKVYSKGLPHRWIGVCFIVIALWNYDETERPTAPLGGGSLIFKEEPELNTLTAVTAKKSIVAASSPDEASASSSSQDHEIIWIPEEPDQSPIDTLEFAFEPKIHPKESWKNLTKSSDCPITAQVSIDTTTWVLQTYGIDGSRKTVGGDEFYIYFMQNATTIVAVSRTSDLGNGAYALKFTTHPFFQQDSLRKNKRGTLVVWLEYSCGIGSIPRPKRDRWSTNGAVLTNWNASHVPLPPLKKFRKPDVGTIDLGQHRSVLAVGDSVMQQFVSSKPNRFYYKNCAFGKNILDALLSRSFQRVFDTMVGRLDNFFSVHNNTAVILGAAAWELQKPYGNPDKPIRGQPYREKEILEDHLDSLKRLVIALRERYPRLSIYWKTGVAMHLHVVKRDKGSEWMSIERLAYMSQSRTKRLYRVQNKLMRELDVPIMDIYPASYLLADRHRQEADAVHYDVDVNELMLSWFYPNGMNETVYAV